MHVWVVPNNGDVVGVAGRLVAAGHFEVVVVGDRVVFVPFAEPFGFDWIGAVEDHFGCRVVEVG